MNRFFSKISIGQRIALAIIIPVIGILILSQRLPIRITRPTRKQTSCQKLSK